jgi:beta-galactosidase
MYDALYDLNVAPDFVEAGDANLSRYKVLLVPPLYSASDHELEMLSDYVKNGGRVVMAFKSGFADEHSTVRDVMAPGPLRAAAGVHYQEFSNLSEPEQLAPDFFKAADQNKGSVWQEFLVPDTAKVLESFTDKYWHFPAITRNEYGHGTLTYEATFMTNELQRAIVRDVLGEAELTGPDQNLPAVVKVRHGRNRQGKLLHYYLNFSGDEQSFVYPYGDGVDLLMNGSIKKEQTIKLGPWDLVIVSE